MSTGKSKTVELRVAKPTTWGRDLECVACGWSVNAPVTTTTEEVARMHAAECPGPKRQGKTLADRLTEIDAGCDTTDDPVRLYHAGKSAWISGLTYLWTGFIERAFVMSRQQAEELIASYPEELDGCEIRPQESKRKVTS